MDDEKKTPDWHKKATQRFYDNSTEPIREFDGENAALSFEAGKALSEGDLTPLATYLKSDYCPLEPDLALEIVSMIEQDADHADFILKVDKHPKLERKAQSLSAREKSYMIAMERGLCVARHGGIKRAFRDEAYHKAEGELGVKKSTLKNAFGRFTKDLDKQIARDLGVFPDVPPKERDILRQAKVDEILNYMDEQKLLNARVRLINIISSLPE